MIQASMRRLLEPLKRRVALIVARAIVRLSNDDTLLQSLQVECLQGEVQDSVERVQEYGFTSRPQDGAEAVVVFPNGNRGHGLVIAVDDRRYRIKGLQKGEVAIYTDQGDNITLKRDGNIEVVSSTRVLVQTPTMRIEGDLEVTGEVTDRADADGSTMERIRTVFDSHVHRSNGKNNYTDPPSIPIG